jgi:hypothetical protein
MSETIACTSASDGIVGSASSSSAGAIICAAAVATVSGHPPSSVARHCGKSARKYVSARPTDRLRTVTQLTQWLGR